MNWLAHLRLAPPAPPLVRLGNLAGDFVRGVDLAALHPELRRGIAQHRAVDQFVDSHPVVRAARDRLRPRLGRFAGVALDVFFDHCLARGWERWGDGRPLEEFAAGVHDALNAHRELLPPGMQQLAAPLARHRWLTGYATLDGIDAVLRAMARRRPRAAVLATGAAALGADHDAVVQDFARLWPELIAWAAARPDWDVGTPPERPPLSGAAAASIPDAG